MFCFYRSLLCGYLNSHGTNKTPFRTVSVLHFQAILIAFEQSKSGGSITPHQQDSAPIHIHKALSAPRLGHSASPIACGATASRSHQCGRTARAHIRSRLPCYNCATIQEAERLGASNTNSFLCNVVHHNPFQA